MLQAFDDARSAATTAQANATIAGIDKALARASDGQQQQALLGERAQVVANEQLDLAAHPTLGWAAEPTAPLNGGLKRTALIGLWIGVILGIALAYARASRRRGVASREDPEMIYGAPLLSEFPALAAGNKALQDGDVAGDLVPVITEPHSAAAEAFRFAAGSIEQVRALRGPRLSLVFVSPGTDGGKDIVVANLAFALAAGGTRVLVIDADPAGRGSGRPAAGGHRARRRRTGGGTGRPARAGGLRPAQPVQRRGRHPRVRSGTTARHWRGPGRGSGCAAHRGQGRL